jgi:hypothetical protein
MVMGVIGSYQDSCSNGLITQSWVINAPGAPANYMETLTGHPAPSVWLNDSACWLEIDQIVTFDGSTVSYYSSGANGPLWVTGFNATAGSFLEASVGFNDSTPALAFYANASSDYVQSENDFTLTLAIGDDPDVQTPGVTAGMGSSTVPQTCADILAGEPSAPDGNYTLYISGNPGEPWTAYCAGMQADAGPPLSYLNLNTNLQNYSEFLVGGGASGSTVTTTYTKVQIDPVAMLIHGGDQTFASSTGSLSFGAVAPITVNSMPYGVAMACSGGSPLGAASVDLTGTQFGVNTSFLQGGTSPFGAGTEISSSDWTLQGGGSCGWVSAEATGPTPVNTADITLPVFFQGS